MTAPVRPFTAFAETLMEGLVAPCTMEIEFDDRLRVKSASGGGGGLEHAPPQSAEIRASEGRTVAGTPRRNRPKR